MVDWGHFLRAGGGGGGGGGGGTRIICFDGGVPHKILKRRLKSPLKLKAQNYSVFGATKILIASLGGLYRSGQKSNLELPKTYAYGNPQMFFFFFGGGGFS